MSIPAPDQSSYNYCALPLAPYACRPDQSRGRIYPEEESRFRTCFQRDRDRIIHSAAFRRLKYKTQVFVYHEGDYYRTRLTHTLEVAQIARTIARVLLVNEDLAETVALAHDLGHTPFAHLGEYKLDECMEDVGGYDHNDQSLRVLTHLECKYPGWRGLNMTWETLEGVVKHNGPVMKKGADPFGAGLSETVLAVQKQMDLELDSYASVEAQIAALADDIAYNNHDVEDGLAAGLFTLGDIEEVELLAQAKRFYTDQYPDMGDAMLRSGIVRRAIGFMVEDVLAETQGRLAALGPQSPADVHAADGPVVAFSADMHRKVEELRAFLWSRMYRHKDVMGLKVMIDKIIADLYMLFMTDYTQMPPEWQEELRAAGDSDDKKVRSRVVADYIAGMTDRAAVRAHEDHFHVCWELRA